MSLGIELEPHWLEASALITAPTVQYVGLQRPTLNIIEIMLNINEIMLNYLNYLNYFK